MEPGTRSLDAALADAIVALASEYTEANITAEELTSNVAFLFSDACSPVIRARYPNLHPIVSEYHQSMWSPSQQDAADDHKDEIDDAIPYNEGFDSLHAPHHSRDSHLRHDLLRHVLMDGGQSSSVAAGEVM